MLIKQKSTISAIYFALAQLCKGQWNSAFLTFPFIIEGASKKVLKFLMPLEPNYKKTFVFIQKMFIMSTAIRFKQ